MVRETGVQSQIESYQRLKKSYLMSPCLMGYQHLKIKGKVEQSRERSSAPLHLDVVAIESVCVGGSTSGSG